MLTDLRGVEDAFFAAMERGYAQSVPKAVIPDLPGAKAIPFAFGEYTVMDLYFTTPLSDKSTRQTIIWHQGIPVWTMHYGGWYANVAIPFLRECLHRGDVP